HIQEKLKVSENQFFVISNCRDAEIVQISDKSRFSKKTGTVLTVSKSLRGHYDLTAYIGWFESKLFYVAQTSRKNSRGEPIFALYSNDIREGVNEIVEGIVDLHVEPLTTL